MKFSPFALAALAISQIASALDSTVVFNEINYNPTAGQEEFIELRNLNGVDVSIAGWKIVGGVDFKFPAGTVVPGGGYVVVGNVGGSLGEISGQLDNGGETLRLVNLNGRVMDELTYDDKNGWPIGADGTGATLTRRGANATSGPGAWTASLQIGGTPGAKNFAEASDPPTVTTPIALNAAWKYRDDNVAQSAGWNGLVFDDSAWASGGALLYAGSPNVTGAGAGLYGYWPLAETSGTTAPNLAAGGTAGTLFPGASWTADATRGQVLLLDGVDGYVDAGTIPQITTSNNLTWSFWANSAQTGLNVIVGNRYSTSGADWVPREFIKFTSSLFQYDHNLVEVINYTDIPLNAWVHHALVKQGTTFTYYRNGVAGGSLTISVGQNKAQPFYFGGDRANENWAGKLNDVAFWTKALPQSSIASLAAGSVTPLTAPTDSSGGTLVTALAQGPTTHYFRKTFTYTGAKDRTVLTLQHALDDGAVFYLNGTEVLRVNMPAGPITHATPASSDIGVVSLSTAIPIPVDALVSGTNVLAVEVHQNTANPDMVFGAMLVASEAPLLATASSLIISEVAGAADANFFVELRNTSANSVSTSGWSIATTNGQSAAIAPQTILAGGYLSLDAAALGFTAANGAKLMLLASGGAEVRDVRMVTNRLSGVQADGQWGYPTAASPGAANVFALSTAIVINEIFYNGAAPTPPALPSGEQWVELYNQSAAPVDVSLWKFDEGISYQFPAGTPAIPAGGYVVVAWHPGTFATLHPGVTAMGPFGGSLSGSGETITLRDANDNLADTVTYADGGRWSQWADGGGSSLELIDPHADNSKGEAWDASDESGKSTWQNVSISGQATVNPSVNPTTWNEFLFGLLDPGEVLIDDISVKDATQGNVELIQNGNFNAGNTSFWRIIGTHRGIVVPDPVSTGNNVLKVTATAETEHMHNNAGTTLKNGANYHAIVATDTYNITFRAKWLRGSNLLHSRLYVNRLALKTVLNRPTTGGTPGAQNSRFVANIGPTFEALSHSPVVPPIAQAATVSVRVADPDGVASVQLFRSINGAAFTSAAMTDTGGGVFTGSIPGQVAGATVQFYIRATDTPGAISFFPAGGAASRAMIQWEDGRAQLTLASGARPHNIRVIMPGADANDLYKMENLMSNASVPCTVIYDEKEVYYRAGVAMKSSEHGRFNVGRVGYNIDFPADHLFLGVHGSVSVDRSGGVVTGQKEILLKTLSILAGGIHAPQDDIIRLLPAKATGTGFAYDGTGMLGAAILSKTRLKGDYLGDQWANGGDGMMFKYERIYVLTQTINPTTRAIDGAIVPENPKIPQDTTSPPGVAVTNLGASPELYRWYWLVESGREFDDYSGMINVATAIGQPVQATFNTQVSQYIDVDEWLRAHVPATLYGVTDNYMAPTGSGQHNALVYFPPGKKAVIFPWDQDFLSQDSPTTTSLTGGGDISKFIGNPAWKRLYYGHLLDVLNKSFNTTTMTRWATHYQTFGTDEMLSSVAGYLTPRAAYARDVILGTNGQSAAIPFVVFARTSASPVTVSTPFATVTGNGWINLAEIRLQGSTEALAITWTGQSTWSVQLPIMAGTSIYILVPYDRDGVQLGNTATGGTPVNATVVITGSGGIFAAGPGNLAVTELNYNPAGSTDATEFIELKNVTGATLDLSGCHFDEELGQGIAYTFASGVQLTPGARILVVRDAAAFNAMYGAGLPVAAGVFIGALDNSGESIVLYSAGGLEIFRFAYNDTIANTDGGGKTLVRVLTSSNSNANSYVWRESTGPNGNPGTGDGLVFSGSPLADLDGDGIPALIEYACGSSDNNPASRPAQPQFTFNLDGTVSVAYPTLPNADDVICTVEATTTLGSGWRPVTGPVPAGVNRFFRLNVTLR